MIFTNIFISGSSHNNINKLYLNIAKKVVNLFSKNETIVIGGIPSTFPKDSMMGIYNNYFNNHKYITVEKYDSEDKPTNSKVLYYTMDRTKEIYNNSDLIILLPGGLGTIGEVTSVLEEYRTNISNKKVILFNYKGFYDDLINFINKGIEGNFISEEDIKNIYIIKNLSELRKIINS